MYQSYIFDLYGTLVDIHTDEERMEVWEKLALFYGYYGAFYTSQELQKAYQELTKESAKGALRHDSHESFPELQIEDVFQELFRQKGVEVLRDLAVHAGQFFRVLTTDYVRLYDGTREMLEELKAAGGKLYLLSNAQRIFTEYEMRALDIFRYFDGIYISSVYGYKKPDIRFFEQLLEHEKINKEAAIMIGNDGICDIKGAKEAGLDTFYIRSNISPKEETPQADFVLEEMNQRKVKELLLGGKEETLLC
nr:HAD family hydrolase [uncultured Sellimonas sp.]